MVEPGVTSWVSTGMVGPSLYTTHWGLLKQPDNQKAANSPSSLIQRFVGHEQTCLILIECAQNFQPAVISRGITGGSDHPPYGIRNRIKCPACLFGSP